MSAELPKAIGYCQVRRELDYARVRIGGNDALIPSGTHVLALGQDGGEWTNENAYSQCHEYVGESVVRFDNPDPADRSAGTTPADPGNRQPVAIPSGLKFDCRIVTPLDSNRSAAGDPVEAVLRSPIRDFRGKVLVPSGAHIHGRLTKFSERSATRYEKASYEIAIRFSNIEIG